MSWIDSAMGIYPSVLQFRSQRSSALAANIANANTPDYKAMDYDFERVLQNIDRSQNLHLHTTDKAHQQGPRNSEFGDLLYRVPTKPIRNGNTVEGEVEQAAFAENAVRYQASLEFLEGAISGLRLAIRGQR